MYRAEYKRVDADPGLRPVLPATPVRAQRQAAQRHRPTGQVRTGVAGRGRDDAYTVHQS